MPSFKTNCAARAQRCMMLLIASGVALLLSACSTVPVPAQPIKECRLERPSAALMQSLPNGSLVAGYQAFDKALIDAIDAGQVTAGQLIDLQDAMARHIAEQGDAANARLIALQDWTTRALARCAP